MAEIVTEAAWIREVYVLKLGYHMDHAVHEQVKANLYKTKLGLQLPGELLGIQNCIGWIAEESPAKVAAPGDYCCYHYLLS